jgi:small subunit ribosomal protein S17e
MSIVPINRSIKYLIDSTSSISAQQRYIRNVAISMGKVRTEMVKRISLELVEKYPRIFSHEFGQNKQFLKEIELDVSKKMRNKIAGYISRIMRIKQESIQ